MFESARQLLEEFGGRSCHALDGYQLLTLGDHLTLACQHILLALSQLIPLGLECCQVQNSG